MEMLAVFEVGQVVLMIIGLLLEADMAIGLTHIMVLDEEQEPLDAIPDEERQIEEFALLVDMNHLVVQVVLVEWYHREDELAQCDGDEILGKR